MSDVAISAQGLGKRYQIGHQQDPYGRLSDSLAGALRAPFRRFGTQRRGTGEWIWALDDVSFQLQQGDVAGVIGRNGSGKSTLLKVLSRITEPTVGRAQLHGRVASLLEVGTGFHPELTGRENVFLSGAVLGMRRAEIKRKFDEIVDFAGTGPFLDTPVKRYSSGMQVRLGFAVAAFLETDLLLVDEVLAVGDADFQRRCLGKMSDVARSGRTVMFVSHNMKAVTSLCSRAMLLDHGRLVMAGSTAEAVSAYSALWTRESEASDGTYVYPDSPDSPARITSVRVIDGEGKAGVRHDVLNPVDVVLEFKIARPYPTLLLCCEVRSSDGTLVLATQQSDWGNFRGPDRQSEFPIESGSYRATIHFPAPLLNAGVYELELYLTTGPFRQDTREGIALEVVDQGSYVSHVSNAPRGGVVNLPIPWDVERLAPGAALQSNERATAEALGS